MVPSSKGRVKKRVWVMLLVSGLIATFWLSAHALREGRGHDRARSPSNGPTEVTTREVRALEGDAALSVEAEASATEPEGHVQAVEAPAVAPQDNTDPADDGNGASHDGSNEPVVHRESDDSRWVDPLLSAVSNAPPANAAPLAERDGKGARREEQLERLRQQRCVTVLDHIRAGLAWLALHQAPDGHFSDAASIARCRELGHDPACANRSGPRFVISTTGLALMAFLDFRDQDDAKLFEPGLAAAARWLLREQRSDGSLSFPGDEDYSFRTAIALTALGHAAASSGDPALRAAVERGMVHVASDPGFDKRDMSTVAYVAQAVEAARSADVPIPPDLEPRLRAYLDGVWARDHYFRQYPSARGEQPHLYPVGMLAGWILWAKRDAAVTETWRKWLVSRPRQPRPSPYSLYYGVRMTVTLEGTLPDPWRGWLFGVAAEQVREGPAAGSFPNLLGGWWMGPTTPEPTFQTAVAVLALEQALHLR